MKYNWKKQYKLQEIPLNIDIFKSVKERSLNQIREQLDYGTQKGNIIMNSKNKKRTALICAAAAALLSVSAIGIHAAADSGLLEKISIWIDGKEFQATISKTEDDYIAYEVINEETADEFADAEYESEYTVSFIDNPNAKFYTELDNKNRLWLKADTDDMFAVDITDELTQNGFYELNCCFADGKMKTITVRGTIEEPKIDESDNEVEIGENSDTETDLS